jgi:amino acid transporter
MLFINIALIFCIVISAVAYLFFKTKQFRTDLPIRKKWYKAKAGIALGSFLLVFGLNAGIRFQDAVGAIVAIAFFVIGSIVISGQLKRAKHEGKFVMEEYELNQ